MCAKKSALHCPRRRQNCASFLPRPTLRLAALAIVVSISAAGFLARAGARPAGAITQNTTWDKNDSPYVIEGEMRLPAGLLLSLKPGTTVRFTKGSSLVIQGDLVAVGTAEEPIRFTSAAEIPAPGDWGSLRFVTADTTPAYDESYAYVKGSRLEHCIIEYGGVPSKGTPKEFLGGAIHCFKSSPYFRNLTLQYNLSSTFGGAIYCHEFSSPYIENCLFLENEARQSGGGLACFFYSNAIVTGNVFQANKADEQGGGIYFSFSSPQILDNIIENNLAKYQGGGLYCSNTLTSARSRVRNNVLLSNVGGEGGSNIYVTAKIETVFQENCLFTTEGYDLFVDALETDLEFTGNYFGPLGEGDLEARVRDRYDNPTQKAAICDPVLESPPAQIPNAPEQIASFSLCGDPEYASDWTFPLCESAPIYLELRALDRNPYHADWIPLRLRSSESDPRGVVTLAWETGPATGIFRFRGKVGLASFAKEGIIHARQGEILFLGVEGKEGFEISRRVDYSRSYITALKLPEEADSLHVINHQPKMVWEFKNIFGQPQKFYQVQLTEGVSFSAPSLWDSGELPSASPACVVQGTTLNDGQRYCLRVRMNSGADWSEWVELALRLNSLPAVPQLVAPIADQVVNKNHPELTLQASTDAEGDLLKYEFQLYQDAAFTRVLAIEKELAAVGAVVKWVAPIDLKDDAEYYWRARPRDPFEIGHWTPADHFYVNTIEEPPLPFALVDPETGLQVYALQPVFSWDKTVDPDPLSKVFYRLLICQDEKFLPAATLSLETDLTFLKVDRLLENEQNYYWQVEAVDNTQRVTPSLQVGHFYVSSTPSVPDLLMPLAGQELKPEQVLHWSKSVDPDPEDSVFYRLQITEKDFTKPLIDEVVTTPEILISSAINYPSLTDDRVYQVRVRAEDDNGIYSNWSKTSPDVFFNQRNTPPRPVAMPLAPHNQVVTSAEPVISWGTAFDPDRSDPPSSLSYLLQFDQSGHFTSAIRQLQVMAGVTQVAVPGLADNTPWFYRLCARDDEGALSAYSTVASFILNTKNDPPEAFNLLSPTDGMTTYQLTGFTLAWQPTSDIDPNDELQYRVYFTPSAGGAAVLDGKTVTGTTCTLLSPLQNEVKYLWWVEAVDLAGACTNSHEKFSLTVNTTPSIPELEAVAQGIFTSQSLLRWKPSTDPDPADQLTYELQVQSQENISSVLLSLPKILTGKIATGLTLADLRNLKSLTDNQKYVFRMRALDNHNAASEWSAAQFILDLQNEPPAVPLITEPAEYLSRDSKLTVTWQAAADPDPSDPPETISYCLQVIKGENFAAEKPVEKIISGGQLAYSGLDLGDNQIWSLRLRAEDSRRGVSPWCPPVKLLVNVSDDPPSSPEIISPVEGAQLSKVKPVLFSWTAATDPDYQSTITYEIRWWREDSPDNVQVQNSLHATTFQLNVLEAMTTYRWQITAKDETGQASSSAVGSFIYE